MWSVLEQNVVLIVSHLSNGQTDVPMHNCMSGYDVLTFSVINLISRPERIAIVHCLPTDIVPLNE